MRYENDASESKNEKSHLGKKEPKKITIDLEAMLLVARHAVNRGFLFSGISRNLSTLNIEKIDLGTFFESGVINREQWQANQAEYKEVFETWVVQRCLEDLVESFENLLFRIFELIVLTGYPKRSQLEMAEEKFSQLNMKKKLGHLAKFGLKLANEQSLVSLAMARNCLTHSVEGKVTETHLQKAGGKFVVTWNGIEASIRGQKDGKVVEVVPEKPFDTYQLDRDKATEIVLKVVERRRDFKEGEQIQFSCQELQEICIAFHGSIAQISKELAKNAVLWGVIVVVKSGPSEGKS